jgi:hypothetical protein
MYRAGWTPATLVIDGSGRILHVHMGALVDSIAIDAVLTAAASGARANAPETVVSGIWE